MTGIAEGRPGRPLSIVHVVAPAPVGGLERVVQGLATGHSRMGHSVAVISVLEPGHGVHPFAVPLRSSAVEVHELRLHSKAFLRERALVRELLRVTGPDVVHTHGYRPDVLHAPTARALSIATVTTEHGRSKVGGRTRVYEWMQRRSFRRFDAVVAVSTAIAEALVREGVSRDKVRLIPNGWSGGVEFLPRQEARGALGLPQDASVVGYVGRFIKAKGPDIFAEAFQRLDDLPLHAVMIGDGAERATVEDRIREAGQASRFRLVGHHDNAAPLFKAFDLFVLSSRTEGTPIVLFEAIAAGVPTVVTAVGGVPDVVTAQESWVVPPEDPVALADAIRRALGDPVGMAERAGRASERLSREFSADLWLRRHEDLYRAVARERA